MSASHKPDAHSIRDLKRRTHKEVIRKAMKQYAKQFNVEANMHRLLGLDFYRAVKSDEHLREIEEALEWLEWLD